MMVALTFICILSGFAALALSMVKHHRDLFGRVPDHRHQLCLRAAGWALLALALGPAVSGFGPAIGIILWFALASLAVPILALSITYRDRRGKL